MTSVLHPAGAENMSLADTPLMNATRRLPTLMLDGIVSARVLALLVESVKADDTRTGAVGNLKLLYAMRISALLASFVGIVSEKLPAVIDCAPNVWTETAALPCVLL